MTKSNVFILMLMVFLCTSLASFANNIETDWMTFQQPNGVEFIGKGWGDEFEFYWETKEGYRFVKNYQTGFWCYAVLSEQGDFKASDYPVGISKPELVGITKNLLFTDDYRNQIKKRREEFEQQLRRIREEIKPNKGGLGKVTASRTVWVDLLLVEFDDVEHDNFYTNDDFNTMFASVGTYEGEGESTPHPDSRRDPPVYKDVFGSVHDYWDDITNGDVDIDGAVWNTSGWIKLDYSKSYYHNHLLSTFLNEIDNKSGYDTGVLGANHLRAIKYAGNEYLENKTLHPKAITYGYLMAAEFSRPQNQENDYNFFVNIGTHCHELGHAAFGLPDRYGSHTYNQWGLMAIGNKNGPSNELACPATLNPYDREDNSWISFQNFTGGEQNKQFSYNYSSPQVFKIAESGDDFFLIENRQRSSGFDRCLPAEGLLVWHKFSTNTLDLIEADNVQSDGTQTGDPFPGSSDNKHLNDFTTPNCKYSNGTNSNVILHNISDASSTMYADLGEKWFGNIPDSLTWENNVQVGGDVTLGTGKILTIALGATVNFANTDYLSGGKSTTRSEIIVNDTLQADGATFTSSSKGDWYGIVFNSGASSSSYLDGCTIENGYIGVYIDGSDPTIDDCEISDCSVRGVYVKGSGAQPTIQFCHIHDNDLGAMLIENDANPKVYESKIYASSGTAAYIYSADGLFCGNEFRTSTSAYGVVVYGSTSTPKFNEDYYQGNLWDMAFIAGSRAVNIPSGYPEFGDSPVHTGANDFLHIGANEYFIYNSSGNTILAESNYWGAAQPQESWFYGSVDKNPYESSSQNAGPSWKIKTSPYQDALIAYDEGKYEEAMQLFELLLTSEPAHERIAKIVFLYCKSAYKLGRFNEKLNVLADVTSNLANEELQHIYRVWQAYYYAAIGDMEAAKAVSLSAPQGSNSERELLLSLIGYYISNENRQGAENVASLLRQSRKHDPTLDEDIAMMLSSTKLSFGNEALPKQTQGETVPTAVSLHAYPNPFNPETEIRFQLPEVSHVTLSIFNLLGQKVRTLLDEQKATGYHSINWDGKDALGSNLASGIYIYRLEAGSFVASKKLMLIR